MSVLHRLSNLLLDPSHPLQDTRTSGAAAGVAEAPAAPDTISSSGSSGKASHAPGLASSPPHVVHQHKSEEQQLCADMINIAASYTDSKGGGASAAVLRGGGGSRYASCVLFGSACSFALGSGTDLLTILYHKLPNSTIACYLLRLYYAVLVHALMCFLADTCCRVLTVHQEDQLVRQALRMLMSDVQPTANLEATKVSRVYFCNQNDTVETAAHVS